MKKPPEGGLSIAWSPGTSFCSPGFCLTNIDLRELKMTGIPIC
jgi:hypothetical protein